MATTGFNVSDELKKRVDTAADKFVSENGGSKSDFLTAMLSAWEVSAARTALPGRADDINDFESHLSAIKASFIQSLSIAKSAREEADIAVKAEIQKAQQKQSEMLDVINELKSKIKEYEAEIKEVKAKASEEVANAVRSFNAEISKVRARAEEADNSKAEAISAKSEAEHLSKELEATKNSLEQLKGRYQEKMELAKEKAETERKQAVIEAKDEITKIKDKKIDELKKKIEVLQAERKADLDAYAVKLKELSKV